jgi:hypothetical protein
VLVLAAGGHWLRLARSQGNVLPTDAGPGPKRPPARLGGLPGRRGRPRARGPPIHSASAFAGGRDR